jgi:tripartite-type tricarboxylate transporter receptor subunit TctC
MNTARCPSCHAVVHLDAPLCERCGMRFAPGAAVTTPAGTPRDRVERLSAAITKIVQSPEIGQRYATLGAIQRTAGPDEFRVFMQSEHTRWGAIVKAVGAKVD